MAGKKGGFRVGAGERLTVTTRTVGPATASKIAAANKVKRFMAALGVSGLA